MVRGFGIAVTAVALMYQCAETTKIARGRGTDSPKARHAFVYRFVCRAFIGFPWPMNAAGIVWGRVIAPQIRTRKRDRRGLKELSQEGLLLTRRQVLPSFIWRSART